MPSTRIVVPWGCCPRAPRTWRAVRLVTVRRRGRAAGRSCDGYGPWATAGSPAAEVAGGGGGGPSPVRRRCVRHAPSVRRGTGRATGTTRLDGLLGGGPGGRGRNMRFTVRASVVPSATQPTRLVLEPDFVEAKLDALIQRGSSRALGSVRPSVRTRRLWRLVRRQHPWRAQPRARADGHRRAVQPGAPRRHRRRGRHRRRRRHPHPGPAPLPAPRSPAFALPAEGAYAVGLAFLPANPVNAEKAQAAIERIVADEGLAVLGWRDVPVDPSCLGASARAVMPSFRHLFIADPAGATGIDLDRKVFVVRKRIEHELDPEQSTYFPSLSSRTLIYKGMLTTPQLQEFFADLHDERVESAIALVHSRFSTNTFPSLAARPPVPVHRPQRRDQHGAGQPQLDAHPRGDAGQHRAPRPGAGLPDLHADGQRLGHVRRGARAAAPRRPLAAPRDDDDDPRGVGEPRHDGRRQAGVLPLPRLADGAVGRAGVRVLHRRHGDRRGARPQRPAARPLLGHRRRLRRAGQRGRRDRHRPGQGRPQGSPAAGPDVPHRHRRRAASSTTTRSSARLAAASIRTSSGSTRASSSWPTCPTTSTSSTATPACCAASRCSATRTRR